MPDKLANKSTIKLEELMHIHGSDVKKENSRIFWLVRVRLLWLGRRLQTRIFTCLLSIGRFSQPPVNALSHSL